ncbi:MAG: hypothetical protein KDK70_11220, partial [Myxococcales bacterium]|nr:hypothetical protein [Myxococcales bacterium]
MAAALGVGLATLPAGTSAQPGEVPEAPADAEPSDGAAGPTPAAKPAPRPAARGPSVVSGSTSAAILPLVAEGDGMPDADLTQLAGRLVEGLRRGAFEVIDPEAVRAKAADAGRCRSAACYTAIAKATGSSHVVLAVVDVDDRDYQVRVVLVDGKDGSEVASTEDSCQICGVAEVGDLLDTAAATLRTKLDNLNQGPAKLVVSS